MKDKIIRIGYHPSIGKEYSLYYQEEAGGFIFYTTGAGRKSNTGCKTVEQLVGRYRVTLLKEV